MIAVYPGSFDPITNGHLDLIKRASNIFEKVIVGVLVNGSKTPLFSAQERVTLIEKSIKGIDNVEVISFSGLLVDFVMEQKGDVIIKGLRAVSDFEYELQMGLMNKKLSPKIETMFMMASSGYSYLSSSIVKEVARFNGDIRGLVPDEILDIVLERMHKKIL